jgi:hypothetical protein
MKPLPERDTLSRRAALQGLAGAVGAALGASAAEAEPHPLEAHLAQRAARPATRGPRASAPGKPEVLDAHQMALLTAISELIVPGSVASGSPAFIDHVLAVERPEIPQRFISALAHFDALARDQHQQPFTALARDKQIALLEAGDGRATQTGRDLQYLKTWIAGAHFSSEPGMKALGFTGGMFFPAFPSCTHQDGHS